MTYFLTVSRQMIINYEDWKLEIIIKNNYLQVRSTDHAKLLVYGVIISDMHTPLWCGSLIVDGKGL